MWNRAFIVIDNQINNLSFIKYTKIKIKGKTLINHFYYYSWVIFVGETVKSVNINNGQHNIHLKI